MRFLDRPLSDKSDANVQTYIIEARIFLIKRQLRLGIRRGIDKRGITFSTPRPSSVGQFNDPCVIGRGRPTSVTQDSGYVPKTIVAMSSLASLHSVHIMHALKMYKE